MKTEIKCFEQYPLWMVLVSSFVSIAIYAIGAYILYQIGLLWFGVYLVYVLFLELRVMSKSCANCYYYGKLCAFGRGKLSAIFFKKGNAKKFCQRNITWKDILPDFLVSIVPLLVGIVLLVLNFNLIILLLVILLGVLTSAGNGFVRGSLACKFCKQRKLGCPAEKLFSKGKN